MKKVKKKAEEENQNMRAAAGQGSLKDPSQTFYVLCRILSYSEVFLLLRN